MNAGASTALRAPDLSVQSRASGGVRRPRWRDEHARRGRGRDAGLGEEALERQAAERRAVVRLGERHSSSSPATPREATGARR